MMRLVVVFVLQLAFLALQALVLSGCECDPPTQPPPEPPVAEVVADFSYSPVDPQPEQTLTVDATGTHGAGDALIDTYTFGLYDGLEVAPGNLLVENVLQESDPENPSPPAVDMALPAMEYGYVTFQLTVDGREPLFNTPLQDVASMPILVAPCGPLQYPLEPLDAVQYSENQVYEYLDPVPLPPLLLGEPLDLSLPMQGGVLPLTWSYVGHFEFPPGLSLTTDGHLVGTPTEPLYPSLDFPFHITDACIYGDRTVRVMYTIAILHPDCLDPLVATLNNQSGIVGTSFDAQVAVEGGMPPYSFWLVEGELPPLLFFDEGVISGIPQYAGDFPFTVRVRDDCDNSPSLDTPFFIRISGPDGCPALSPSIGSPFPGSVGVPYLWSGAIPGGHHPVAIELSSGSIPPGLILAAEPSFQGSFQVSGTPTEAGTFPFSLRATDSCPEGSQVVTEDLEIVIEEIVSDCDLLTLTSGDPPEGWLGQPYSFTFSVSGGDPPIAFQELLGIVGLTLDSETGVLSGTPEFAGTYTYQLVIYDSCSPVVQSIYPTYSLVIH